MIPFVESHYADWLCMSIDTETTNGELFRCQGGGDQWCFAMVVWDENGIEIYGGVIQSRVLFQLLFRWTDF